MKTIELFSGTESFSRYARKLGHETFTVDNNLSFCPDMLWDLSFKFPEMLKHKLKVSDVVWMSPPCTVFSMASGNKHWNENHHPKTRNARLGYKLLKVCHYVANMCIDKNKIFFIENPRARARWFLPIEWRKTVWYCQYGDKRAKPTDIWTNLKGWTPKTCHNGNKECHHEPAPRGSKSGTQGLKGAKERGVIPEGLFKEIFEVIERRND